ncbi:relaxase/mobilization nuclease domain-containing protein [Massilia niabensis]|uniref:Relaxase/mobilization nuclease domain-containing protein n=1 Tax=Massilia niabensis TaxID=544910 RepID=A0ABW0LCK9_9BURK
MIAKHIPMHAVNKSGFASLVRYLTDTQSKQERTGDIRMTNCIGDDVEMATLEVLNTQAMNTRSRADKTYHLILSFRDGEEPDASHLASIEERICDALGFSEHQRVSVVHHDTDNRHLHIAINKIHPTRFTIHEPFHAYQTLARACDDRGRIWPAQG